MVPFFFQMQRSKWDEREFGNQWMAISSATGLDSSGQITLSTNVNLVVLARFFDSSSPAERKQKWSGMIISEIPLPHKPHSLDYALQTEQSHCSMNDMSTCGRLMYSASWRPRSLKGYLFRPCQARAKSLQSTRPLQCISLWAGQRYQQAPKFPRADAPLS